MNFGFILNEVLLFNSTENKDNEKLLDEKSEPSDESNNVADNKTTSADSATIDNVVTDPVTSDDFSNDDDKHSNSENDDSSDKDDSCRHAGYFTTPEESRDLKPCAHCYDDKPDLSCRDCDDDYHAECLNKVNPKSNDVEKEPDRITVSDLVQDRKETQEREKMESLKQEFEDFTTLEDDIFTFDP